MNQDKPYIRRQIQQIKKGYSPQWLLAKSKSVCDNILTWSVFKRSTNIFAYLAMPDEINLDCLILAAINQGKNIFVPHIVSKEKRHMQPVRLTNIDCIKIGEHNIRTAKCTQQTIHPNELDLVLVPGLGFSKCGVRIGVGGGYYDRFLPQANQAVFAGIVLKKQIFANLPYQKHDVFMDYIVSEFEIADCLKMQKRNWRRI